MPLKLVPPSPRSSRWRVRGTHLGVSVDRSTLATDRETAKRVLASLNL